MTDPTNYQSDCWRCDGEGTVEDGEKCPQCQGRGVVQYAYPGRPDLGGKKHLKLEEREVKPHRTGKMHHG